MPLKIRLAMEVLQHHEIRSRCHVSMQLQRHQLGCNHPGQVVPLPGCKHPPLCSIDVHLEKVKEGDGEGLKQAGEGDGREGGQHHLPYIVLPREELTSVAASLPLKLRGMDFLEA